MHSGKRMQVKPVCFILRFQHIFHRQCKYFTESALKFHNLISSSADQTSLLIKLVFWYQTRKDSKIPRFEVGGENNFRKSTVLFDNVFSSSSNASSGSSGPQLFIAVSTNYFFPLMEQFTNLKNLLLKFSSFPVSGFADHHIKTFAH